MAIWRRFWVQKWPKIAQNSLKWPKTTPNHPQNGQKWCRNIFGKIDFWSFWGHFGSFWGHFGVILGSFWGHFGSFWVFWVILNKMTKHCLHKPNMTLNHPHGPKNGSKIAFFFSFCMENTHFSEFCHHGFQNRLKTSIFYENRSILAQIKSQNYDLSRGTVG